MFTTPTPIFRVFRGWERLGNGGTHTLALGQRSPSRFHRRRNRRPNLLFQVGHIQKTIEHCLHKNRRHDIPLDRR